MERDSGTGQAGAHGRGVRMDKVLEKADKKDTEQVLNIIAKHDEGTDVYVSDAAKAAQASAAQAAKLEKEPSRKSSKKLVRSASLLRFQEMVFREERLAQERQAQAQNEGDGAPSTDAHAEAGSLGGFRRTLSRNNNLDMSLPALQDKTRRLSRDDAIDGGTTLVPEEQPGAGSMGGLVRQLSRTRFTARDGPEDSSAGLMRRSSRRDSSLDAVVSTDTGEERPSFESEAKELRAHYSRESKMPEEALRVVRRGSLVQIHPKDDLEREKSGIMYLDENNNAAISKSRGASVKYKKAISNEIPQPPLYFTESGVHWYVDVFAFYGNAVRQELTDLYYLLNSMCKRDMTLGHDDLELFFTWFDLSSVFLSFYFLICDKLLWPWVEERVNLPSEIQAPSRRVICDSILKGMADISDLEEMSKYKPPGETLPHLVRHVNIHAPEFASYLRNVERLVGPAIASAYTPADKKILDDACIDFLWSQDEALAIVEFLARPFRDETQRVAVRRVYLASRKGVHRKLSRRMSQLKGKREYGRDHSDIMGIFYERYNAAYLDAEISEGLRHVGPPPSTPADDSGSLTRGRSGSKKLASVKSPPKAVSP
ncbi:hypothetical protein FVE85_6849 [Porphyridium purpureum]|uniref:Uncharacterized protein n=1 Tax=Porphyridium purpureum TaxID=35688 RepID=A0A5J4Z8G0_PORPP|nr:hypothetical protein FVE85_6849 [Porphyridium purpureum]|eukprot:POR7839..scf295_1